MLSWLAKLYPDIPCPPIRAHGNANAVLSFICMLGSTEPMETDDEWWQVRMIALFEAQSWRN